MVTGQRGRRAADRYRRGGQSLVEYALLFVTAAAALAIFFGFVRNAMSYRYKSGADGIGHGMRY